MALGRLSSGERISGGSAMLLFALTAFDWFGVKASGGSLSLFDVGRNAWEALDYIPIVLLVTTVIVLAEAMLRLIHTGRKLAPPVTAMIVILGTTSTLLIAYRIVDPPSFGSFGTSFGIVTYEGTVKLPIFLALVAAVGVAYGGYRAMREEGVSFADLRARRHGSKVGEDT
jgi:hypothetical protein